MRIDNFLRDYPDVLSPEEVQSILHVGRTRAYKFLSSGTIKSIRIGRKYRIPKFYLYDYLYPTEKEGSNE